VQAGGLAGGRGDSLGQRAQRVVDLTHELTRCRGERGGVKAGVKTGAKAGRNRCGEMRWVVELGGLSLVEDSKRIKQASVRGREPSSHTLSH
jgi:hypothetical protein